MPGLKELREQKFMTTRELSRKTGLSSRTINRMEYGIGYPYFSTIKKVAAALGVDPGIIEFKPADSDIVPRNTELAPIEVIRKEYSDFEARVLKSLDKLGNEYEGFQKKVLEGVEDLGNKQVTTRNMVHALLETIMESQSGVRDSFIKKFNQKQNKDTQTIVAKSTEKGLMFIELPFPVRELGSGK